MGGSVCPEAPPMGGGSVCPEAPLALQYSTALFTCRRKLPQAWGVRAGESRQRGDDVMLTSEVRCGSVRHAIGTILRPVMYRGDPGDTGGGLTGFYGRV